MESLKVGSLHPSNLMNIAESQDENQTQENKKNDGVRDPSQLHIKNNKVCMGGNEVNRSKIGSFM